MGQHLGKHVPVSNLKESSTEHIPSGDLPESPDEVFGQGEADLNQNNGCSSKNPAPTDSITAEVHPNSCDPNALGPRPHLVRLFSRDAPGREDNTFKERPSESDELQTIHENGSECGEAEN